VKVLWAAAAEQDRADIFDYIARENPNAAAAMDALFSDAAARLAGWPRLGRPGRVPGTRELLAHEHYFLVYDLDEAAGAIHIVAVLHTSRQRPPFSDA
jgi:addiction module RelE/StbE family toxin